MDISFGTNEGRFNYRVCAVIIHDNKLLVMRDNDVSHYYLPGGRVRLHETAEKALLRELSEELCIRAEIGRPLWLAQSFFTLDGTEERFHEMALYFLVNADESEILSKGENFVIEENGVFHRFEWVEFAKLKDMYFYPLFLKEAIYKIPEQLTILEEFE